MPKVRWVVYVLYVANFKAFQQCIIFENRLRFDKVTESLKVKTFLRHSVVQLDRQRALLSVFCFVKFTLNYLPVIQITTTFFATCYGISVFIDRRSH